MYYKRGDYNVSLQIDDRNTIQKSLTIDDYEINNYYRSVLPDSPVTFTSNIPDYFRFNWIFGDGTFSTEAKPTHIYTNSGTYNVSLIVNYDSANIFYSQITVLQNPYLTQKICGLKSWHHIYYTQSVNGISTDRTYPDTSFAITFIDDFHISIKNSTYTYGGFRGPFSKSIEVTLSNQDTLLIYNSISSSEPPYTLYYAKTTGEIYVRNELPIPLPPNTNLYYVFHSDCFYTP